MRDSEIEQWVLHEIRVTTDRRLKELCVFSSNGVVNLKGTVSSRTERLAVEAAATRASGVIAVISNLLTIPRVSRKSRPKIKERVTPTKAHRSSIPQTGTAPTFTA